MSQLRWIGKSLDGQTVTLHKFDGQFGSADYATAEWMQQNASLIKTAVAIDVETTGLDKHKDSVIEVGLRQFLFNRANGDLLAMGKEYSGLQDPGKPLTNEVSRLTGLTDEMLQEQQIDWSQVDKLLSEAHLVIAHNAAFDRPFIEKSTKSSSIKPWACSLKQIDWAAKGYHIHKLEVLCIYHGFFSDAHRALGDTDALIHLLSMNDPATGRSYLAELLTSARRPIARVIASNSPFESKDALKHRGYSWNTTARHWHRVVFKDELDQEIAWLEGLVYNGGFRGNVQEISLVDRFK